MPRSGLTGRGVRFLRPPGPLVRTTGTAVRRCREKPRAAPTLEEKLSWQKQQNELEHKRNKLRRELFDRQDQVEDKRNDLISDLEQQLTQKAEERPLFVIEWELV